MEKGLIGCFWVPHATELAHSHERKPAVHSYPLGAPCGWPRCEKLFCWWEDMPPNFWFRENKNGTAYVKRPQYFRNQLKYWGTLNVDWGLYYYYVSGGTMNRRKRRKMMTCIGTNIIFNCSASFTDQSYANAKFGGGLLKSITTYALNTWWMTVGTCSFLWICFNT